MAKIASAGRSGPHAPESFSRATRRSTHNRSTHVARSTLDLIAPHERQHVARLHAVTSLHRCHTGRTHCAATALDPRYTFRRLSATGALYICNNQRNIRARSPQVLRYLWRSTAAISAVAMRPTCALHTHELRDACGWVALVTAHYQAALQRVASPSIATVQRPCRARLAADIAPFWHPTRAFLVAYRRECDAILAPMNPPLFPHTRATPSPLARHTGATSRRMPLIRGGQS